MSDGEVVVNGNEATAIVEAFGEAWNSHDLEAALAMTTEDCVFESTGPAPDGERHVGREAVRAAWEPVFEDPTSHFDVEDRIVAGGTVVQRWRYDWGAGHIRGIDVIVVRDGLIAQKLSYVKG
ncbi:MAG TPA: nuclear transport factor 2 family protein [Acidimicrobiales bacterium]|nr:nuclear transport factor 2 family protein [Acidimicrobiales bacterium]